MPANRVLFPRKFINHPRAATVGGPPAAATYHASAVNFDGSTYLSNDALVSSDNQYISHVVWFKTTQPGSGVFTAVDPDGDAPDYFTINSSDKVVIEAGTATYSSGFEVLSVDEHPELRDGTWHCLITCVDAGHAAGSKIVKVYLGDTEIPMAYSGDIDNDAAFTVDYNGLPLFLGSDQEVSFEGDMADLRVMPGVSLLVGGDITEEKRRLFIDASGKPVDPAIATAALGTPAVLLSGNAATFSTNQGSGGAFTLTGSLTNASTSPSD